jgi:hypothetical protein
MTFNWRESSVSLIEVCGGVIPCFVGGVETQEVTRRERKSVFRKEENIFDTASSPF